MTIVYGGTPINGAVCAAFQVPFTERGTPLRLHLKGSHYTNGFEPRRGYRGRPYYARFTNGEVRLHCCPQLGAPAERAENAFKYGQIIGQSYSSTRCSYPRTNRSLIRWAKIYTAGDSSMKPLLKSHQAEGWRMT